MIAALIITLRETLEASLIIGIILAYLGKTENKKHKKMIWLGVLSGVVFSVILAFVFERYLGGFDGTKEELYEGVTMLIAAALLTWMILWMLIQRHGLKKKLEEKVHAHIEKDHPVGLFFLTFVSVAREGIETVIFLNAALLQANSGSVLLGGVIGVVVAILLAYILFKGVVKIKLRKFFTVTSVLLILFAAGLFAHGIHEFQEAGIVPIVTEHLWDMNAVLDEKGTFGGILKGVFGYNGNPSLIEVISYWGYLVVIGLGWYGIERKK